MPTLSLPDVPGLSAKSQAFRAALYAAAVEAQVDPDALSASMSVESGFKADAVNPTSGASGLIQWMPSTALLFGTTVANIRKMTDLQQLPLVVRYFQKVAPGGIHNPDDVYLAIFSPAMMGRPDESVLFQEGQAGYEQNAGLDRNGDKVITVGDVRDTVRVRLSAASQKPRLSADPPPGGIPGPKAPQPPGTGGVGLGILIGGGLAAGLLWVFRRKL